MNLVHVVILLFIDDVILYNCFAFLLTDRKTQLEAINE